MASWDSEDFDVDTNEPAVVGVSDKWEGEDEDDDIADSWDALDEDEDKEKPKTTTQPKKKKTLDEKIKEREEKRRLEKLAREEERKREEEANRELTPEEQMAEKLRQQRLQEESDLELAKEAFGITEDMPGVKTIDKFVPDNREEFNELSQMLVTKLQDLENKSEYPGFLETLFRDCCASVDAETIKKIASTLNVLASEKQKLSKPKAGKKKGAKTTNTLKAGKASTKSDMSGFNDDYYDEYEDFM